MKSKRDTRDTLSGAGVAPSKAKGQNFLHDQDAIQTILDFAAVRSGEALLEVGPGLGALTIGLAAIDPKLRIIELEQEFTERLKKILPSSCRIITADTRTVKLSALEDRPFVVISNVPYSISSEFCFWLFENAPSISRASLLFQREFAERLAASPASRAYGSLTVLRSRFASAELGPIISAESFHPRPRVESRLVALDFKNPEIRLGDVAVDIFEEFVRLAFHQKRKTLINNLASSKFFDSKLEVKEFLEKFGLNEFSRAEEVSPQLFTRLVNGLR